ncbi:hypothetical protein [uncultured Thiodictyon sp.]|uniref:hypothetical protein n=1 Tax=uncultured Thiodictyon sp. TaxID=1846217 RepID=UPI0025F663F1|nr:hypothetical protein [uncultured Thiodictyon sp.]
MSKLPFMPLTDGDYLIWDNHFDSHLPALKVALGLTDEDLATSSAHNQDLNTSFAAATHAAAAAKQATADIR